MKFNAAADRVAVRERMENLAQTATSVGSGDIGYTHLAVMARTAEPDEPLTGALSGGLSRP
jgi:ornithine cyclodeaminase/alanine dehydrogenase-like protein (mu-crystallin family)